MGTHIPEISESIEKRVLVLFCGAGISRNSGLPLANELKRCILEKLLIDEKNMDAIMNSTLPFEAFMEIISENTDISKILDIFEDGKPNTNHFLIAKLAKNGHFKTIFTTNFDLLLEKALMEEGLRKDRDFKVYCNEKQFSGINFENVNDKMIRIFKIHGSIDNRNSIRVVLNTIASKTLSDKRINVVKYLFSSGEHEKVLILGYSCSDAFDINPQILSIEKNQKEIIFVEHSNEEKEEIEDIKIKGYKNPFKKFPGKRIKCNTDEFIEGLWNSLKDTIGEYINPINSNVKWETYLDDWIKQSEEVVKNLVVGSLFYTISDFRKAIEYYEKALKVAREMGDKAGESKCYVRLGNTYSYYGLGDFDKAIEYYEKSLEISKEIGDKKEELACYISLGTAYYGLGSFNKAIEYYEKSSKLAQKVGNKGGEARSYSGLGVAYDGLGDFNKAIEYYEKSLMLEREIGDKSEESRCYLNLGVSYDSLGDFNKAIEYYEKSLEISKEIGDKEWESASYGNIGVAYDNLGDFNKAIEYYEKSLEILKDIEHKIGEARCYTNLGNAFYELKDFNKAIEYHKKSLEISKEIGDKVGEAKSYTNLGNAYGKMEDFNKTIDYHERGLVLDKEIGNKEGEGICYVNLGETYHRLGEITKAIEYFLEAEKIFVETGQSHYLTEVYKKLSFIYENIGDIEINKKYKKKMV